MKKIYSDEEINNLISDVEENYMLKAPPNLKNDILDKIKKDEIKHIDILEDLKDKIEGIDDNEL